MVFLGGWLVLFRPSFPGYWASQPGLVGVVLAPTSPFPSAFLATMMTPLETDFDWHALSQLLGEVQIAPQDRREDMAFALARMFDWLLKCEGRLSTEAVGRRVIGLMRAVNPERLNDSSKRKLAKYIDKPRNTKCLYNY
jgi:hypothetical protein